MYCPSRIARPCKAEEHSSHERRYREIPRHRATISEADIVDALDGLAAGLDDLRDCVALIPTFLGAAWPHAITPACYCACMPARVSWVPGHPRHIALYRSKSGLRWVRLFARSSLPGSARNFST
jgi:hypothetical protein